MRLRTAFVQAVLLAACGDSTTSEPPKDGGTVEASAEGGAPDAVADVVANDVVRECPTSVPEAGGSCGDLAFLDCRYPEVDDAGTVCERVCHCGGQEHFSWSCEEALVCP